MALVFASDVHQIKAFMTPANVASKSIDAVPKPWTENPPSSTFINICRNKGTLLFLITVKIQCMLSK